MSRDLDAPNDGSSTRPWKPAHDDDPDAVLNGIAFDEVRGRLYVTGKRWTGVYEVTLPVLR